MNDDPALRDLLLRSIDYGVAVFDADSWEIVFENARFFHWFPPAPESNGNLTDRLPDLDREKLMSRLEKGRPYRLEVESRSGGREVPVRLEFRRLEGGERDVAMVEAANISKEKEAQYMLESYSRLSEKNARALEKEKDRVERLLLNIMPRAVYDEMRDLGTTTPQRFQQASILMLDLVGFTDMAIAKDPSAVVSELNDIFSAFDRITETFGSERLRTVGDSYMAVSGLPDENPDHAVNIARVALRMRHYLERRNSANPNQFRCRIGLNTGPVIGSLVGVQKYVYDLFGPGVNLAARMEGLSEAMKITTNEHTMELLRDRFRFTEIGKHEVKGFGTMKLYWLDSEIGGHF